MSNLGQIFTLVASRTREVSIQRACVCEYACLILSGNACYKRRQGTKGVLEAGNAIIVFPDLPMLMDHQRTIGPTHTLFSMVPNLNCFKNGVLDSDKPITTRQHRLLESAYRRMPELRISEIPNSKSKVSGAIHTTPDRNEDSRFRGQDRRCCLANRYGDKTVIRTHRRHMDRSRGSCPSGGLEL